MQRPSSLAKTLAGNYDIPLDRLDEKLQKLIRQSFAPFDWDSLTPEGRRTIARQLGEQHPINLADKETARRAFLAYSISKRNQRNAKQRRPSRQKISDFELRALKRMLVAEGIQPWRQCPEAHKRWSAKSGVRISLRKFRARWNLLGLKKDPSQNQ